MIFDLLVGKIATGGFLHPPTANALTTGNARHVEKQAVIKVKSKFYLYHKIKI